MVVYVENGNLALIDGYKFRKDKNTGYFLSTKKIGEKRKRLHVYVAEKAYGEIPKGYDVHHKNGDKNNNEPENLEIIESLKHQHEHSRKLTKEERERRVKFIVEHAMPKAKDWHSSAEGIEWHKKHGAEVMAKRENIKYICSQCGKEFESTRIYKETDNKFCSNNCKSAFRRNSGIDDEERVCECCGKTYMANKYTKRKYCSVCWNKEHRISRKS